jgi:type I restriction enzyme S subunit
MKTALLGDLCTTQSGGTPRRGVPEFYGGNIPWVKIGDITNAKGLVYQTEEGITRAGLEAIGGRLFPPGTLLLAMYGSVGKVAVAGCELSTNQAILGIRPRDESRLDLRFLRRWLEHIQPRLAESARGVAQANVSKSIVDSIEVPVLPLAKQRELADVLDKADAIRRKRQEAIALTEQLLRSTFLEMFGAPKRHGWPMVTVEALASGRDGAIRTGPFGSDLRHSEFVDSGIMVLGIDNAVENEFTWGKPRFVTHEKYEELRRYTVFPGDVIITIMGTCGRCAIVPEGIPIAINTKHLCCITLDKTRCLPEFLHSYFLFHPDARAYLERTAKGAIMDGLNMGIIKALPVPVVPMALQHRYQTFVSALSRTKKHLREQSSNADSLFQSLVQRAFSGQL